MSAADDMSGWLESVGLNPAQTAGTKAHFDYLGVSEPSDLIRLKPTEVEGLNLPLAEKYKLLNAIKAVDLLIWLKEWGIDSLAAQLDDLGIDEPNDLFDMSTEEIEGLEASPLHKMQLCKAIEYLQNETDILLDTVAMTDADMADAEEDEDTDTSVHRIQAESQVLEQQRQVIMEQNEELRRTNLEMSRKLEPAAAAAAAAAHEATEQDVYPATRDELDTARQELASLHEALRQKIDEDDRMFNLTPSPFGSEANELARVKDEIANLKATLAL